MDENCPLIAAGCALRKAPFGALLALGLGFVSGCDRTDVASARASACARFCEALEKCDDATDLLDCRGLCEADEVRSDRYFQARADCGEKLSCSRWAHEVSGRGEDVCNADCNLLDCVDDRLAQVKLNELEKNVCMALGTKLNACSPQLEAAQVTADCEDVMPVLSEAYVDQSARCSEQLCGQMEGCFEKLADRHQTTLRLFPGSAH